MGKAFERIKAGLTQAVSHAAGRRYPVQLRWSDEDAGYLATAPDLPGCSAWGATEAEAISEARDAIGAWLMAATAANRPIPAPTGACMN